MKGYCLRVEYFGTGGCNKHEHCTECGAWVTADEIKTNPNPTKPVDPLDRAKELAEDHWEYVKGIHIACEIKSHILNLATYHYKTAFEHGYKHALEDIKSKENN